MVVADTMRRSGGFGLGRGPTALLFFLAWLIFEWLIFSAIAVRLGFFLTIFLYVAKGGLGLVLLAFAFRRIGLSRGRIASARNLTGVAGELAAMALGAILIAIPGILPTLAGLALFSPSVRKRLGRWFLQREAGGGRARNPDEIDLDAGDYRRMD
jgi:UPF0716 family protein affecting phage T7 exclusion